MLHQPKRSLLLRLFLMLLAPLAAQAAPSYTVTVLGGAGSIAYDVNIHGHVAGTSAGNAWIYNGGVTNVIGSGHAFSINDAGQVAGTNSSGGFFYDGTTLQTIAARGFTAAYGINSVGTVVGSVTIPGPGEFDFERHAFSYAGGVLTDLGMLYSDTTDAYAINSLGSIVGGASIGGAPNRPFTPFLYRDGVMRELGPFDGPWSEATSINDRDQVVGYANLLPDGGELYPRRAFIWDEGVMTLLDGFGPSKTSYAWDINLHGDVVGWSDDYGPGRGFLYHGGAMMDINTLIDAADGWTITDAKAINDVQQIAGTACRDGLCYAVRLDPVLAVPEPASWSLLVGGMALLGWRQRRTTRLRCVS